MKGDNSKAYNLNMYRISGSYAVTLENRIKIQSFTAFLWKKPLYIYIYRKIKHFWIPWNLRMILNCISFTGEKDFLNVSESNKFRIKNNLNVMVEGLACIGPISRFNPESLMYKEKWFESLYFCYFISNSNSYVRLFSIYAIWWGKFLRLFVLEHSGNDYSSITCS